MESGRAAGAERSAGSKIHNDIAEPLLTMNQISPNANPPKILQISSMATTRPRATFEEVIMVAEVLGIDCQTTHDYSDQPTTLEEFAKWQEEIFAEAGVPTVEEEEETNCRILTELPTDETATNTEERDNVCGICQGDLVGDTENGFIAVKLSTCQHALHQECLEHFFQISRTSRCPYCREEIQYVDTEKEWWIENLAANLKMLNAAAEAQRAEFPTREAFQAAWW